MQKQSAKLVAVRLLSRCEHSAFEIRDKLAKREFDSSEIEQAVIELIEGDWLSDERFAEAYNSYASAKKFRFYSYFDRA